MNVSAWLMMRAADSTFKRSVHAIAWFSTTKRWQTLNWDRSLSSSIIGPTSTSHRSPKGELHSAQFEIFPQVTNKFRGNLLRKKIVSLCKYPVEWWLDSNTLRFPSLLVEKTIAKDWEIIHLSQKVRNWETGQKILMQGKKKPRQQCTR